MAEKEKTEVSLVKVNAELYREAAEIVEANRIEYPSIKNFVEVAVRNQINSLMYDLENRDQIISKDGKLIAKANNAFTPCIMCGNLFLNSKEKNKQGKKICQKCIRIVKNLNKLID